MALVIVRNHKAGERPKMTISMICCRRSFTGTNHDLLSGSTPR